MAGIPTTIDIGKWMAGPGQAIQNPIPEYQSPVLGGASGGMPIAAPNLQPRYLNMDAYQYAPLDYTSYGTTDYVPPTYDTAPVGNGSNNTDTGGVIVGGTSTDTSTTHGPVAQTPNDLNYWMVKRWVGDSENGDWSYTYELLPQGVTPTGAKDNTFTNTVAGNRAWNLSTMDLEAGMPLQPDRTGLQRAQHYLNYSTGSDTDPYYQAAKYQGYI